MVRKRFDRTVVKKCPKCEEQVPVACKFCTCGHPFASRNKLLLKEEAEEAMGHHLDRSDMNKDDESPMDRLRRPRRLSRDKPTYYVIPEINRQVKRARQRVKQTTSSTDIGAESEMALPKRKRRGRPRGSGARNKSRRKSILKQQQQLLQIKQEPLIIQLPKQEPMDHDSPQATSPSSSSSSSSSPHTPPQSYYHQLQELEFSDTKMTNSPTPSPSIATSSGVDRKLNLSNTCSVNSNNFGTSSSHFSPVSATTGAAITAAAASSSSSSSSTGEISIKIENRTSFIAATPSPPLSSSSSTSSTSLSATVAAATTPSVSSATAATAAGNSSNSKNKGGSCSSTATTSLSSSSNNNNNSNNKNNISSNISGNISSSSSNNNIMNNTIHSKDNNNSNSSVSSSVSSNSTITTNYGTKNISNSDSNSNSITIINNNTNNNNTTNNNNSSSSSNNNNNNNSSSSNNNNNNGTCSNSGDKDMYSSLSPERALQFYAILADLNRKIISQSFKPW